MNYWSSQVFPPVDPDFDEGDECDPDFGITDFELETRSLFASLPEEEGAWI